MNSAETKRDERISKTSDLELLRLLVATPRDEAISEGEFGSFLDMLAWLQALRGRELSRKQRSWAEEVAKRVVPLRAEDAPRGREVETPEVLRKLPKAPPGRKL